MERGVGSSQISASYILFDANDVWKRSKKVRCSHKLRFQVYEKYTHNDRDELIAPYVHSHPEREPSERGSYFVCFSLMNEQPSVHQPHK